MRGHWPASRAAKRQRRRPENEPRYCRARRRAAHCSAKASASSAPCLRSSARDAASISRLANMPLARAFHASPPTQNGTTAGRRTRRHRTRHALEIYGLGSAYRMVRASLLAGAGLGRLAPAGLLLLVGGYRNWFGFLERRIATQLRQSLCRKFCRNQLSDGIQHLSLFGAAAREAPRARNLS